MQNNFLEKTTEAIREQITKIIGTQQYYDEVWKIKIDGIKNYKGYFNRDNSCNIGDKILRTKKNMGKVGSNDITQLFATRSFDV